MIFSVELNIVWTLLISCQKNTSMILQFSTSESRFASTKGERLIIGWCDVIFVQIIW